MAILLHGEEENLVRTTNGILDSACAVPFPSIRRQQDQAMLERIAIAVAWRLHESRLLDLLQMA